LSSKLLLVSNINLCKGQSIGSLLLGIEALVKFIPDIYMETTGYAFTYPLFAYIAGVPVCCYTHYPTISTDMLDRVMNNTVSYNNRALIGRSPLLTKFKMTYYQLFAKLYSMCGRCAQCCMVNSSWTRAHIDSLWSMPSRTRTIYPPCDVAKFASVHDDHRHDENFYICSVAQFRPEKNHQQQIRALAKFIDKYFNYKLIIRAN
jgi:alpha-1,2-mannosyltransferase